MTGDPLDLLRRVVESCETAGVSYAVIGAVARNAWAPPRATTDVDVAVAVAADTYQPLLAELAKRDVSLKRTVASDAAATVPDIALLEGPPGPVRRADLLIAKTDFEREAIDRAVTHVIGLPCRVVRPEHLIVYKLIAGRPRDFSDAGEVMRTRSLADERIDLDLIRHWANEWGVTDRLQRLLDDVEP
jgi:predicted nucleotidyltransferase